MSPPHWDNTLLACSQALTNTHPRPQLRAAPLAIILDVGHRVVIKGRIENLPQAAGVSGTIGAGTYGPLYHQPPSVTPLPFCYAPGPPPDWVVAWDMQPEQPTPANVRQP